MENEVYLGNVIKAKRLSLNLTMSYVAKQANISRSTLWSIERGTGNCSMKALFEIMNVLGLSFSFDDYILDVPKRERATRTITAFDKKVNRFVVMCIEQYAKYSHKSSDKAYMDMKEAGAIDDLIDDYEDLHGMSTEYLNEYINAIIGE